MTERDAMTRLRQGDIGGLELLVRAYQVPALRAACLITLDLTLAEDVVGSAFLRARERIAQLDDQSFEPWFLRSVVNDALKATTRGQCELPLVVNDNDAEVSTEPLTDPSCTPEELVAAADARDALRAALGRMSPAQRAAIVQRFYLDMSENDRDPRTTARQPERVAARRLEVYIGQHCLNCEEALRLADEVATLYPRLHVRVIDLDRAETNPPEAVVAVPTYLLDGRVIALGNPYPEELFARLREAGG
jgi:RNA polymerase sigma-70 factor (ECF subfamily)